MASLQEGRERINFNALWHGRFWISAPDFKFLYISERVAVMSAKNHKRQRRKRQSVTAKREKSQTPKVLTAILT